MFKLLIPAGLFFIILVTGLYFMQLNKSPTQVNSSSEEVSYVTSDEVTIIADWYPQAASGSGVVILLHMLGSDRSSWTSLAASLQAQGLAVLAPDFRGHGRSTKQGRSVLNWRSFTSADYQATDLDLHAAFGFLDKQQISRDNIQIVGASLGANAALIIGAEVPIVKSVVLLSPAEDYRGVGALAAAEEYRGRRALIIYSMDDEPSASGSEKIAQIIGSSATKVREPGSAHGSTLLLGKPSLVDTITSYILSP